MPQWAGSCWYYLRYMDPDNTELPFSPDREQYWGPVDLYIGGVEHAVLHLLYARFWHKVLYDCGLVHTKEPFQRLFNQGMLLAHSYRESSGKYHHPQEAEERDGSWYLRGTDVELSRQVEKMGKSKKNVVDPLEVVKTYGADTLRMYVMFMGPLEQVKPWQTSGCEGLFRFLGRVWRLFVDENSGKVRYESQTPEEVQRALHVAIKETTQGIEDLKFNTPISKMMEFVNATKGVPPTREDAERFLRILSPYAPHIAEEIWQRLGNEESIAFAAWPVWDDEVIQQDTVTVAVQVQGKMRGKVDVTKSATKDDVLNAARANPNVAKWLQDKEIVKEIVVPGRLVNFVVR